MSVTKEIDGFVSYEDWVPEVEFGGAAECDSSIHAVDHARHVVAVLQALGKDGMWYPVGSPFKIHSEEAYSKFRVPALLRLALYGQDILDRRNVEGETKTP